MGHAWDFEESWTEELKVEKIPDSGELMAILDNAGFLYEVEPVTAATPASA